MRLVQVDSLVAQGHLASKDHLEDLVAQEQQEQVVSLNNSLFLSFA